MNKLQLRAEIIKQINSLKVSDLYATNGDNAIETIKSFNEKDNSLDILLKELKSSDGDTTQVIAYLILELSRLEDIQEALWDYIKDFETSDYIKEVACSILRAQGGSITIEELSEYLNNPEEIIDAETKKLLEESFENPEALIDFLDFLFALNEEEQVMLLESLKNDYPQNYVANILIPALNSNPSLRIKEVIIDMLGDTKSEFSVKPLTEVMNFSNEPSLEKKAHKSLNMLKLSGVDLNKSKNLTQKTLCTQNTQAYKAFSTTIDGAGNQGFIVGRLRDDGSIQMFSTVINDTEGVIDCFGFNTISDGEFERIIKRFETKNSKIEPSFDYIKYRLEEAQLINKKNNFPLSYEFVAWKELLSDVKKMKETPEELAEKWGDDLLYPDYSKLEDDYAFDNWFLEEEDNEVLCKVLDEIKTDISSSPKKYLENIPALINLIEEKINQNLNKIFNTNVIKLFINRLENTAYLLNTQDKINLRNTSSSLVKELKEGKDIKELKFFNDMIKKSIYENLLREKEIIEDSSKTKTIFENETIKNKYNFKFNDLELLCEKLFEKWN